MQPLYTGTHVVVAAVLTIVQISYSQNGLENTRSLKSMSSDYSEYPDYETDAGPDRRYSLDVPTNRNQEEVQSTNGNIINNPSSVRRSKENPSVESLHMTDNWPDANKQLGQLTAVSLDNNDNVVVFHRGDRVWNSRTFLSNNVYSDTKLGPITQNTIVTFHATSGNVLHEWGSNLFYMPHGITLDKDNNVWITDVALHQVFKFAPNGGENKQPLLALGVAFTPGRQQKQFCKPTDVAIMKNGDFFVSDGYCNSRVVKYSPSGEFLMEWGRSTFFSSLSGKMPKPYEFSVPHALTLAEDKNMVCAADRENGRVQCFNCHNGTFVMQIYSPVLGSRIFSVAYTPAQGGQLVVVNGPDAQKQTAAGFVVSLATNQIAEFQPTDNVFRNPHDVAVSPSGKHVYVVELNPYRVWKFDRENGNTNVSNDTPLKSRTVTATTVNVSKKPSVSSMNRSRSLESHDSAPQAPATIATAVGVILVIIAVIGLVVAAAIIRMKKRGKDNVYSDEHKIQYSKLIE